MVVFLVDHLGKLKIENVETWRFSGLEKTDGGVFRRSSREIEYWKCWNLKHSVIFEQKMNKFYSFILILTSLFCVWFAQILFHVNWRHPVFQQISFFNKVHSFYYILPPGRKSRNIGRPDTAEAIQWHKNFWKNHFSTKKLV